MSDPADSLAVIAAESDQLTAAFRDRRMLPVDGVERLGDAIADCILRDLGERPTLEAEEVEAVVRQAATFALLVGAQIAARRA